MLHDISLYIAIVKWLVGIAIAVPIVFQLLKAWLQWKALK